MQALKNQLIKALREATLALGVAPGQLPEIDLQETPKGKPGDYGTPLAFRLARVLNKPPSQIAEALADSLLLPKGVKDIFVKGGYLNVEVEPAYLLTTATRMPVPRPQQAGKVLVEHTSVNPNKELHLGHMRNICLGDALARILQYIGRNVEVLNYIDDTGRQAAESLFALSYYKLHYPGRPKYDHWVGQAYVRLHQELAEESNEKTLEPRIREVIRELEQGRNRADIERILDAQLESMQRLGAAYDLLIWESDLIGAGLLERALALLGKSPFIFRPQEGKYAGALVMNTERFIPGLEDPYLVLVRSDGTATYTSKDIALQFWKVGLLEGLTFKAYHAASPDHALHTSAPGGQGKPMQFGQAHETINVIDVRQSHPQAIVKASLEAVGHPELAAGVHHLAYETVLLEGRPLSGRKGHTISLDEVLDEAAKRARSVVAEKNPNHENPDEVAEQVGVGAVRFAMVKSEPKRQIDFRWAQALSFEGDSGPYVQYAHARARSILRKAGTSADDSPVDFSACSEREIDLAKLLLRMAGTIEDAAKNYMPHLLAQYLLELSAGWNTYYTAKDEHGIPATPVLSAPPKLRAIRLALVGTVARTLRTGLQLLGIAAPEVM